ncbi:hypothetical protein P280DRAFT_554565 [Massarina eburnea CBS 473.64]|uniref:Uncharacterized protein n=1 Tax=Massarina eburnea CBS 473.64 TaxID=1395130 RepID=A0A6A6RKE7_9PLEO|nr:hypothetical protein P280DRAFT_554565 [Massarina eburnea CBS 473.64]
MGVDIQRPPLPAPTEPSTLDSATDNETTLRDDVDTNISARTDKTSYSIPEDGSPVTINTTKREGALHKKYPSQTSLLIEYFEGGKTEKGKIHSRPSVRVRVTPSSRRSKSSKHDHLQITQTSRSARKPSYTRRITLGKARDEVQYAEPQPTEASYSEGSNVSSLPPVDIEVLHHASDLSSVSNGDTNCFPMASDISSMPPDSLLEGEPMIKPPRPRRRRSRSLERDDISDIDATDTLQAPTRQRSRSLSKERITARVMEKLQQKPAESSSSKTRHSRDESSSARKRRSKNPREEEMSAISGTESSLLSSNVHRRSGDTRSAVSGVSSINNPKLLATVEDAIKRLILPELNALKEEQRTQKNRSKFEDMSRTSTEMESTTSSRDGTKRRVSKSSSAPHIHDKKPKVVLNRDENDPGTILSGASSRKDRRSSRGSTSERSYAETHDEKMRRKKSKDKSSSARDAAMTGLAGAGLTAAALKHHNSREDKEERHERRKKHSHPKSRATHSRTVSRAESVEEEHFQERMEVPPLPILQSELQGSEMTRDSILSAETETRGRPDSSSSHETGVETPLREVARGYASPPLRSPTKTPAALQRALGTAHGNRSQGEVNAAMPKGGAKSNGSAKANHEQTWRSKEGTLATEAAAAAKIRAIESSEPQPSQYEIADSTPTRGSPVQSEASYRDQTAGSPRPLLRPAHSGGSMSSAGRKFDRPQSNLSIQSFESSPSTKAARTRKRPQGVTLERPREALGEPDTPGDSEDFFAHNHEQNEIYRRERELETSDQGSPTREYQRMSDHTDGSAGEQRRSDDKLSLGQDILKVGSNPEFVHTPLAVESAVASLVEQSNISFRSSVSSPIKKSRLSQVSPMPDYQFITDIEEEPVREHSSQERWGAIRDQAQTLAEQQSTGANSPRHSLSRSIDDAPTMHASAIPTGDMMPEFGYGVDDESDVTTNPSIIKGPIGGGDYYDQTEELLSRQEERERTPTHSYGKAATLGGTAASAMAAAAARSRERELSPATYASVEEDYNNPYAGEPQHAQHLYDRDRTPSRSPALWKDEGYQSANQPAITPEGRNRTKLLEDDDVGQFDDASLGDDDFYGANSKHGRHLSGNSHGMESPLYDSATGKGLDRIESKDIVALMDHLTVRDAQRNARDTEILVTLVRSAAEMRTTFEEMKQFIKVQDQMIMSSTDKRIDLAEQRIIGGPRPQPLGSPRVPRSSTEELSVETKKKSVFKRALKGLSMKSDGDIKKIEVMLIQLLGEVEGLKQFHQLSMEQQNRSNSLTSYENLRASGGPESGYEPEGRANTASSPNQSGYLSNPSSRRIQDLHSHSGYDVPQHRVSTVQEDDEEYEEDGQFENTERMTTPTQEARRNVSYEVTPPSATKPFRDSQSQDNTPKRKHKSTSSSIFGIPKISRWSKTTASTNPESLPRNSGSGERRPSNGSRSGSQVSIPYGDGQYELSNDDRLRSNTSLERDGRSIRSASPLFPEDDEYAMDDPKYKAHRNSLNLQHPQPRAGPTGRHQNQLESQARIFDPIASPDYDQWGSNPSLARNRLSGGGAGHGPGNLSPISSDGGYSQHSASEQQHGSGRSKMLDDGPLIPQQQQPPLAGHGQARQMYSSPNEYGGQGLMTPLAPIQEVRYSLETDRGHRYSPTPSSRASTQSLNLNAAMAGPQRKVSGPRPMGSRSPSVHSGGLQHSDTVIRRKPVTDDTESLQSYRSSLDSEIF